MASLQSNHYVIVPPHPHPLSINGEGRRPVLIHDQDFPEKQKYPDLTRGKVTLIHLENHFLSMKCAGLYSEEIFTVCESAEVPPKR
jgi:hypothetical protein